MNEKNIYKRALQLAVPMMIQNGITNMVGLVDNVMVGSLGTEAMTGVSIIGQLIFVFNLSIFGGLSGPGIYGAQYYGQKNIEGLKNTFRIKWLICSVCAIAGILVFSFAGKNLVGLYLHGESTDVDPVLTTELAMQYLQIMLLSIIPFVITQIYAGSLRETGDSVKPMVAGIVSVVVDVVFNYIMIYGKFGVPALGVRGAAIATVMARVIEMCVVIIWAHIRSDKHEFLKGVYKTLKVPKDITFSIIKKGLPIFFNEFMWAGGIAAMTQIYSIRGLEIVAGFNISNAICNLLNVIFVALGSAVGILIGQTLGASEYDRAKKESFKLMKFTGAICIGLMLILIGVSGFFPEFYDTTDEIKQYATKLIIITALFFPVQGFLNALYFTLRSGGKTFITFLFDSVFTWCVAVTTAFILCVFTDMSIFAVYACVQAIDVIKLVIGYILIQKGIWISNIVDNTGTEH